MSTPAEAARPVFTLTPTIPLDKEWLRETLAVAMAHSMAVPAWGKVVKMIPGEGPTYLVDEREWDADFGTHPGNDYEARFALRPPSHRVDLYTLQRGLLKAFDLKYSMGVGNRMLLFKSLFEQNRRPSVFEVSPFVLSEVIQLALFDQIVY